MNYNVLNQLGVYFTMDIEAMEEGFIDLLAEDRGTLEEVLLTLNEYIRDKSISVEEKDRFIDSIVFINFNYYNLKPLGFLKILKERIEYKLSD